MSNGYWERFARVRLGRRRALAVGAGAAAAAAILAACGGDDGDGASPGSGLLITPKGETATRKRGGTLSVASNVATATLEQSLGASGSGSALVHATYSQLMRMKLGIYSETATGVPEPEFAKSFEMSDDGLTFTFKLRGMKFDDRPPTSGRVSNSADVKYSWKRFEATNPRAPELSNNASADSPVIRVDTPDEQTAVFHLAFPFAPFLAYMSSAYFPFIYPVEADGGYETKSKARGTGAWRLPDERPTGDALMERNPNYYHPGEPYFDKLSVHSLTEYATIYSQFAAGNLDFQDTLIQEDVLRLKKDHPDMVMYQRPFFAKGAGGVFFGRQPGSPWNDDRVRKALAMNMDAALWGDNYSNRTKFEAEGLPVNVKWNARAGPGYRWWLDPEKNELGEASKYLHYDPKEAHKLLVATGLDLPIKSTYHNWPNPARDELYQGMLGIYQQSGDFKFDIDMIPDFNTFMTKIRNTGGKFDGFSVAFYFDHHDYDWTMNLMYNPASTDFWLGKERIDPKMTDFVNRQRRELDIKKREAIFQEFLKYDVQQMYYLPYHYPANWRPYYIGPPWLGGWGWWQPYIEQYPFGAGQILSQYWFDESKKKS